jgi:hypothetical protein
VAKRNRETRDASRALRQQLVRLLEGGQAHVTFDQVIKAMPPALRDRAPRGLPYSTWQLLQHMRLAQWDILEFSRNEDHVSPEWPGGYWPREQVTEAAWRKTVQEFRRDLKQMQDLVSDPKTDLFAPIRWGDGQTVLREALLVADHNAYHLAEIVVVRRLLGAWR